MATIVEKTVERVMVGHVSVTGGLMELMLKDKDLRVVNVEQAEEVLLAKRFYKKSSFEELRAEAEWFISSFEEETKTIRFNLGIFGFELTDLENGKVSISLLSQ